MFGLMESGGKEVKVKRENIEKGKRQKVENLQQMKMENKRARGV